MFTSSIPLSLHRLLLFTQPSVFKRLSLICEVERIGWLKPEAMGGFIFKVIEDFLEFENDELVFVLEL